MEKKQLVAKYGLFLENGAWYSHKENTHKHMIFKDTFYQKTDLIGLLFRINKLCMAKVKYFRANIGRFITLRYDYHEGFVEVPLWDAEFFQHRVSGHILDLRFLQSITVHQRFLDLIEELDPHMGIRRDDENTNA